MAIQIANFFEADRLTAFAGEALDQGEVVALSGTNGSSKRVATSVTGSGQLLAGNVAVAVKFSNDEYQVIASTVPSELGSRLVTIGSGDVIVAVRNAIIEYDISDLHASITASNVAPGEALSLLNGKFCKAGTGGAIASPVVGRVYDTLNGKVRVELVL